MEIGLAVGGAFLSSGLQVLFDRLAPQGELFKMFQKHKPDLRLLHKLKRTLLGLQIVLCDADNKQASNPHVTQWLNGLQDSVDTAENMMEEINYQVLKVKVDSQYQTLEETSNTQVSDPNLCLSDEYFLSIKKRLEETIETLEELERQIGHLDLKAYLDLGKQVTRSPSTSVVDNSDIFGRQNEIDELVGRLLSVDANGKNLTVIPVVGMGGIGKTTLAKVVYNDDKVKHHFDLKAWFCVSEPYDAIAITKGLLLEIDSFDTKDASNLNQLQIKLKESLKGKRFLIVLDDVWNENYDEWDNLRNLFVQGSVGSKIIVTTRKERVALMMGSGEIKVGTLSSEVSWALFKRHSLENWDPEFEEVGRQIAYKCKGLPLALKALAGVLRSKFEVEEWRDISKSETWELSSRSNGILPALLLSYNDLPAHLKRCFAYCAIFPRDYPFCKEQVIFLWIANGLADCLHSGNQYFVELRSRSLFERVPMSSKGHIEKFLMHDLVNDLAQIASSKVCIRLEESEGSHMLERSRHMSYSMWDGDFEKLKPLSKLKQLRTLLPVSIQLGSFSLSKRVLYNILPRLTSLRALSLSEYDIKELPNELFVQLKLLKFLDLSWTEIKQLPNSICELYNLETLLLSSCRKLEELPPQMENLINLRHLDISNTSLLKKSPPLSKMKSIHVLLGVTFFLGGCSGSRIENLDELDNLYGSLSISELQHVVDRREVVKAKLRKKEHVEKLSLEWSSGGIAESSQNERNILDELQPNRNIKEVNIKRYRGTSFPYWLADELFFKLVTLSLSNCKDCYSLPALGQLPSLKFLAIREMHRITEVTEEFYGDSSSRKPFNSLEKLEFVRMLEWKEWHVRGNGEFPALQELSVEDCPKLIGKLPGNLCSLTRLKISWCPQLIFETHIQLSSLKKLEVDDCDSLTSLPFSSFPCTLKEIRMHRCGKLKLEFSVSEMMSRGYNYMFLESLKLYSCGSIDYISDELVPRARTLRVADCHNLARILIPAGTEDMEIATCENLEMLSVSCGIQMAPLCHLCIMNCKKLKSLPEHMPELLPSLNKLILEKCPEIESFPEGGLPLHLEVLWIRNCKKLVNCRKEWHLQSLSCLRELRIIHSGSAEEVVGDEDWELPCSIQSLTIWNLKTFSTQVLKSLTSLEYLSTYNLPQIQSLLEEGLPPSLSELTLHGHDQLHSLPAEGLGCLTSLRRLEINRCHQLQSLSELELPSSLSELHIKFCPNLQSLPGSALPSSLSELHISDCDNLQTLGESVLSSSLSVLKIWNCSSLHTLPVKGMPSSISQLSILGCPLLKPLLEFQKGNYWPKIAHIPTITFDLEYL